MITMEQFETLKGAMDEAQNDDTPYIGTMDNQLHVFGDPNKTEIKSADYTVLFAFPDTKEWRKRIEINGDKILREIPGYVMAERTYKNVYLSPKNIGNAMTSLVMLEQFLNDITEDGEIRPLSLQEMQSVMLNMNGEMSDVTYDLVAAVLRIPEIEKEWMLPTSVFTNAVAFVLNNPSTVNEADLFFGLSPSEA